MLDKTKVHTVYKNADGKRIPGVTTILGILDKSGLLNWAWKCGCEGLDYKKVSEAAADVGTLTHYLIMCYLTGETPDTNEYSLKDIGKAEACFSKYLDWHREHPIKPLLVETPMVSEKWGFGGTIDCLAELNGKTILIDHKTGKAIWPDMLYQLAAYKELTEENGYQVDGVRIIRIGRDEDEGFEERIISNLDKQWEVFYHCLYVYDLQKEIRREK